MYLWLKFSFVWCIVVYLFTYLRTRIFSRYITMCSRVHVTRGNQDRKEASHKFRVAIEIEKRRTVDRRSVIVIIINNIVITRRRFPRVFELSLLLTVYTRARKIGRRTDRIIPINYMLTARAHISP